MLPRLVDARHVHGYTIWLRFTDGAEGEVDLGGELHGEVFEPLKDVQYFQTFSLHPELRTLVWPNGADFAPEFLRNALRVAVQQVVRQGRPAAGLRFAPALSVGRRSTR